jgi:hypothetical protein
MKKAKASIKADRDA